MLAAARQRAGRVVHAAMQGSAEWPAPSNQSHLHFLPPELALSPISRAGPDPGPPLMLQLLIESEGVIKRDVALADQQKPAPSKDRRAGVGDGV